MTTAITQLSGPYLASEISWGQSCMDTRKLSPRKEYRNITNCINNALFSFDTRLDVIVRTLNQINFNPYQLRMFNNTNEL